MSLGITQLKAAASKNWSCLERVGMCSALSAGRGQNRPIVGRGLCVKAHYRESNENTSTTQQLQCHCSL